jgi:tripartite-type tricarboxylate transporter receptor subunit TctC
VSKAAILALGLLCAGGALAQGYPSRPIRIIMPTAPGSPPDHAARVLATRMGETLGQALIVENRGGAGGTLGASVVAKSAPDGYTLMMGSTTSLGIGPALFPSAGIDPVTMFAPVSQVAAAPSVIAIPATLPANDLREFIVLVRANPGKYNYGSPAVGSPPHVSTELFLAITGLKMVHVAWGDPAKVIAAVITGDAQLFIETVGSIGPQVRAGKMRLLAVADSKRHPQFPDVPSAPEAGLADFESGTWSGLLAPSGTPAAIVQRLNAETRKAVAAREMKEVMFQQGGEAIAGTPEAFAKLIALEQVKWAKAVALAGVKPQ